MKRIIRSEDRGLADHGWLKSHHSFSFADYYNPSMMGFRSLRVINEDRVAGGHGFPTHPHRDMEIITFMVGGTLEHQDTMGHKEQILPGDVQRMSAGSGVRHSEMNPSPRQEAHLLQIWITPDVEGIKPEYEQRSYADAMKAAPLVLVTSKDGRSGSMKIHQDADLWVGNLKSEVKADFVAKSGRNLWFQMVKGELKLADETLAAGDAVAIQGENQLSFIALKDSQFLLFDLA